MLSVSEKPLASGGRFPQSLRGFGVSKREQAGLLSVLTAGHGAMPGRVMCTGKTRQQTQPPSHPHPSALTASASSQRQQTAGSGAGVCAGVGGIFKGVSAYTVWYRSWHLGSESFRVLLKRSN